MKTKTVYFAVLFLLLFFFMNSSGIGGPVMPNETIITGIVSGFEKGSPYPQNEETRQPEYNKITVLIESSEDVDGEENILTKKKGEHITFYTKEPLLPGVPGVPGLKDIKDMKGKRIKVHISYRGDEHGGLWWGYNLKILQQ